MTTVRRKQERHEHVRRPPPTPSITSEMMVANRFRTKTGPTTFTDWSSDLYELPLSTSQVNRLYSMRGEFFVSEQLTAIQFGVTDQFNPPSSRWYTLFPTLVRRLFDDPSNYGNEPARNIVFYLETEHIRDYGAGNTLFCRYHSSHVEPNPPSLGSSPEGALIRVRVRTNSPATAWEGEIDWSNLTLGSAT